MVAVKTPSYHKHQAKVLKTRPRSTNDLGAKVLGKADSKPLPVSVSSPSLLEAKLDKSTACAGRDCKRDTRNNFLPLTWRQDAAACLENLLGNSFAMSNPKASVDAGAGRDDASAALMHTDAGARAFRPSSGTLPQPQPRQPFQPPYEEASMDGSGHGVRRLNEILKSKYTALPSMDSSGHDVTKLNSIIFQKHRESESSELQHKQLGQADKLPLSRLRSSPITGRKRSSSEIVEQVGDTVSTFGLEPIAASKVEERLLLPNGKALRADPGRSHTPSPNTSTETTPVSSPSQTPPSSPTHAGVDMEQLALTLEDDEGEPTKLSAKIDEFISRLQATGADAPAKIFLRGSGTEYITRDAAQAIANALRMNGTVKHLGIVGCGLTLPGAKVLAEGLRANKTVTTLDFSRCGLTFPSTIALIEALNDDKSSIRNLYLQGCGICDASATVIAHRLAFCRRIRYLCLSQNRISKTGIAKLARGIKANEAAGGRLRRVDH